MIGQRNNSSGGKRVIIGWLFRSAKSEKLVHVSAPAEMYLKMRIFSRIKLWKNASPTICFSHKDWAVT